MRSRAQRRAEAKQAGRAARQQARRARACHDPKARPIGLGDPLVFGVLLAPGAMPDDPAALLPPVEAWLECALGNLDPRRVLVLAYTSAVLGTCPSSISEDEWKNSIAVELLEAGRALAGIRAFGDAADADRLARIAGPNTIPILLLGAKGRAFAACDVLPLSPGGSA